LAGSWPSWRGPNRDAISTETGLLDHWTGEGPPLKWKATGLGSGFASVAVVDGRIYTMGTEGKGSGKYAPPSAAAPKKGRNVKKRANRGSPTGECKVIVLNAADGKEFWSTIIGSGEPNCTPTVDGDRVYALTCNGQLACLDAAEGKIVWSKDFVKDFGGGIPNWGYSESPLVDGEKLVCTPGAQDAMVVALDKKTGQLIWKAEVPEDLGDHGKEGAGGYSSIVISNGAGVKQYVQLVGRGLVAFRADDGKFLWSYNRIANPTANIPTPIAKGDYVFGSSGYGAGSALLKLERGGEGVKAKEVYFLPGNVLQNHHGGMVLLGDYLYCGNGHNAGFPMCIEFKTGKPTWKTGRGPGTGSAAVLEAEGELYFRYENGVMALIEADPHKYVLKGKFNLATHNGNSWPHPVIVDRCLYLRDQDALLCYDIAKH
jgi:outer membrane protein assembly factor BamB